MEENKMKIEKDVEEKSKIGFAITAMVIGIVSLLVASTVPALGFILEILAIIFGSIGIAKKRGRGMAVTGLVCGIIGLIITIGSTSSPVLNNSNNTNLTSTTSNQIEEKIYSIGEEAVLNSSVITVTDVKKSSGDKWNKPDSGKEYVIVYVTIKNRGKRNMSYSQYDFKMQNNNGQIDTHSWVSLDTDTRLNSGELASGGNVSGTIIFEEPIDDAGLILLYSDNIFSSKQIKIKL